MSGIIFGEYEPSRTPMERGADAIISVFFDGTGNNRKNVHAYKASTDSSFSLGKEEGNRKKYLKAYKKNAHKNEGKNSYNSDESNVSRLQPLYVVDKTKTFSLYIEGIGTDNFKNDSIIGSALGSGNTGIKKRVEKACKIIANETLKGIKSKSKDSKGNVLLEKVVFDLYGFSRGAAAARHFISQVKKKGHYNEYHDRRGEIHIQEIPDYGYLGKALKKAKITVNTIEIRFAGLYDTVSAHGLKHKNDHKDLELNQLFHAEKTVQLIAQDEIRHNFELTDITSAGSKGLTISLPGVHSDIGGGYLANVKEEKILLWDLNNNKTIALNRYNYFIAEGWYRTNEIEIIDGILRDEIYGIRNDISNNYSVLPLLLMGKLSEEYNAGIDVDALKDDFKTEGALLKEVEKRLDTEFLAKYTKKVMRIDLLKFDSQENEKELLVKGQREFKEVARNWGMYEESLNNKPKKMLFDVEKHMVKRDNTNVVQPYEKIVFKKQAVFKAVVYDGLSDHQLLRSLRNRYLHISFDYTNATSTNWWQYVFLDTVIRFQEPMKPRANGVRMVFNDTK
ncbi:MAG: DUF2235 domain-containing protein [Flavobacteriaceae bacterium]|nr:DUF2235 domain-containing protein [Flavobacteriaceae bacterium]